MPRGVRLNPSHDERTRAKIQTSQIINRLHDHFNGKIQLSATQVKTAEILLRKTLPDLAAIEHNGAVEHRHYAITDVPQELAPVEWIERYRKTNGHALN